MNIITGYCIYARPAQPGPIRTRLCGPCIAALAGFTYFSLLMYEIQHDLLLLKVHQCSVVKLLIEMLD